MKCVILAGGIGSRFWPFSRKNQPKQLLNIFGEESMLQITVNRLKKIRKISDIYIITRKDLYQSIIKNIGQFQVKVALHPEVSKEINVVFGNFSFVLTIINLCLNKKKAGNFLIFS